MTTSTANLTDILMSAKIDLFELDTFLLDYFGHASQVSETSILYGKEDSLIYLTLTYSKDHKFVDNVSFGKKWTKGESSKIQMRIEEAFFLESPHTIGRAVLFSRYPVDEFYSNSNTIHIRPAPDCAPRPRFLYADHPFIMEFSYNSSKNDTVNSHRFVKRRAELSLLLSVLLEGTISDYHLTQTQHVWVLIRENDPHLNFRSEYLQRGYSMPGLQAHGERFSSTNGLQPIVSKDPAEYYGRFEIESGRPLQVPSNLGASIERFCNMSEKNCSVLMRACYWSHQADAIHDISRSASYLALVNAIECLIGEAEVTGVCKNCGREIKDGPTKLFRDFIESFAPDVPLKLRGKLYAIRSKLSHGSALLPSDVPGFFGGLNPGYMESMRLQYSIRRLVSYAIYNWLHKPAS